MAGSSLMSIGQRAMAASYAQMTTTSNNIANANVAGYSRQEAQLATAQGQYTGAGFFGKGVDVTTVTRAHDAFLTSAAATAKSLASMDSTRQDNLNSLQAVFPTGTAGLGYAASTFLNSMSDLATQPSDSATRQTVLANAQNMVSQFNSASSQLDSLQAGVTADLSTSVSTINGLASSIAQANQQIAALNGLGQPPNDLLDQRDQLINQLSAQVQVSTVNATDGTVGVFISGGQRLVLGNQASQLQVTQDPDDPSRSAVSLNDSGTLRALDPNALGGGSIAGLLSFQNNDLVQGRNLIGQLAAAIGTAVNQQQTLGVNLQQPIGTVASKPMFAIGAPVALPSASNAKDASGNYASSVTLTITDASALQPANYELRADPGGADGVYQLTRLSNPQVVQSIQSGDVVDGMRIDIGTPPPTATDRFLLKPVGQAAGGMQALLQDPLDLAAASPLTATAATANTGTAVISSLTMNTLPPQPAGTAQISFTSDAGDYNWQVVDASNNVLSTGTGTWQAGQPIPTPPNDINGFSLNLAGVPRSGDTLTVAPTPAAYISTNNGNALAMTSLRDATLVGKTMAADGSTSGGATATDAYASALADIGVRVQTATTAATTSTAMSTQADAAATSVSGVNLDEEAARLIQFQQSYQAAAKVLQIAQSVFQTLLQTVSSTS